MARAVPGALAVLLLALALGLAACGSSAGTGAAPTTPTTTPSGPPDSAGQAGSAGPVGSTAPTGPTGTTAPTTSAPASSTPGGATGCTSGSTAVPIGAVTREIIDVDGDGRADTAWLAITPNQGTVTVGIVTAAGGGFQRVWSSASPVTRSMVVVRPNPASPPLVLASDGRLVDLWAVSGCALADVLNKQGKPYQFGLGVTTVGTGVGCATVGGTNELVGLNESGRTGGTVTWTSTVVQVRGTAATNGTVTPGTYRLPADAAAADALHQVTCGPQTIDRDGLTLPA